jgi:anion-transporting  ArsA/GET3 family ATPase
MAKRDLDKSASRFLNALRRTAAGLEQQRQRILDRAATAPRLLPDSQFPVIDLTGDPENDLDYYIYELARLQDIGKSMIKIFGQPQELLDAQAKFDVGIPNLRVIRNPLTHPNDNDELDEVAWFSSAVKLKPDGSVEELIDPRYEQHEVATAYWLALTQYLRARVRLAIAADPPKPIDQQIADRTR